VPGSVGKKGRRNKGSQIFGFSNSNNLNLDWQKNCKTNVEKALFFIFMSSYAEMSFRGPKKRKSY
jgi:hypothetical protein